MDEIEKVPEVRPDEVLLQKTERLGEVDRVPGGCEIEAEAGRRGQFAGRRCPGSRFERERCRRGRLRRPRPVRRPGSGFWQ